MDSKGQNSDTKGESHFNNIVHNDNIWKTHCQGEVDQRTTWQSRWGFFSDEMEQLKRSQKKLPFSKVRQTNYSLNFQHSANALFPQPKPSSSSRSSRTSSSRSLTSISLPPINNTDQNSSTPLNMTILAQSRKYGRISNPLEVFGPYCKGKRTAEKSLGWPRY
eukprot:m.50564 g.50564  ORF g.50564 m.50564 type:complete len:163 (+) comp7518_c0_seq6:186-674(+)